VLTVLYLGRRARLPELASTFGGEGLSVRDPASFDLRLPAASPVRLRVAATSAQARRLLSRYPVGCLVIDLRSGGGAGGEAPLSAAELAAALAPPSEESWGCMTGRGLLALVDGGREGARAALELGHLGVPRVLVEPTVPELRAALLELAAPEALGRVAVCLAGGGIEGMLWELGVLRALDWFLADRPLVDLDLFTGISAGAILGAFLANGLSPAEITRGMLGQSRRIDPIRRREIFDVDLREMRRRAFRLLREIVLGGDGPRGRASSLARAVPPAVFAGEGLRRWLRRQLSRPGMSDRFDALRRPLYVGATDQDTAEPVVLGDRDTLHVPVHQAVRASSALVPFYPPERIDGRYLVDGAFSRTTNMRVAVEHGATLVLVIDPLVPVRMRRAGYVHERGGLYATSQGIKSLIHGRFDKAVAALRERFPGVSFHLFQPEAESMRMLGGSPMKLFFREEVERVAFETTVASIRRRLPALARDMHRHGVGFVDPELGAAGAGLGSVPPSPLPVAGAGAGRPPLLALPR